MFRSVLFSLLVVCVTACVPAVSPVLAKDKAANRDTERLEQVRHQLDSEYRQFAKALRSLDQSYGFRGMKGCGSFTAGSIFIDWDAKGVEKPKGLVITPPPPLDLSGDECRELKQPKSIQRPPVQGVPLAPGAKIFSRVAPLQESPPCVDRPEATPKAPRLPAPQLQPPRTSEVCSTFRLIFCVDLAKASRSASIPILWIGDSLDASPVIVDHYRGELRLRLQTDQQDCFGSYVHEVNLGEYCGLRCFEVVYAPNDLRIVIDGHSFPVQGVDGILPLSGSHQPVVRTNQHYGHGRIRNVSCRLEPR